MHSTSLRNASASEEQKERSAVPGRLLAAKTNYLPPNTSRRSVSPPRLTCGQFRDGPRRETGSSTPAESAQKISLPDRADSVRFELRQWHASWTSKRNACRKHRPGGTEQSSESVCLGRTAPQRRSRLHAFRTQPNPEYRTSARGRHSAPRREQNEPISRSQQTLHDSGGAAGRDRFRPEVDEYRHECL